MIEWKFSARLYSSLQFELTHHSELQTNKVSFIQSFSLLVNVRRYRCECDLQVTKVTEFTLSLKFKQTTLVLELDSDHQMVTTNTSNQL